MTQTPEVNGPALEKELRYNPDVVSGLERMGAAIAADARIMAPKRTPSQGGAKSIHHEVGGDEHGTYVRVSWDRKHWYMRFAEFGTSHENARPFLRPAAMKPRTI